MIVAIPDRVSYSIISQKEVRMDAIIIMGAVVVLVSGSILLYVFWKQRNQKHGKMISHPKG